MSRSNAAIALGLALAAVTRPGAALETRVAECPTAERVRYVGEPVALVVAETAAQAQDAAEALQVDYAELPAASDVERARAPGAPLLYPEAPGNVALDWEHGDANAVEAAFARAAHKVTVRLEDNRVAPVTLEPRAAIGAWDAASGRYTLTASTQGVSVVRKLLADHDRTAAKDREHGRDAGGYDRRHGFGEPLLLTIAEMPCEHRSSRHEGTDQRAEDGLDGRLHDPSVRSARPMIPVSRKRSPTVHPSFTQAPLGQ